MIPGLRLRPSAHLQVVLALILLAAGPAAASARPPGTTKVYHPEGKDRVHVEGCRRLADTEGHAVMTLAEAEAKGLPLCSRCPGSTTRGKGNPPGMASWVNPPPAPDAMETHVFQASKHAPLASMGSEGQLVYRPYTDQGDRLLDFSFCGYKRSEVPIPDVRVVAALSPPSGEATPQGRMAYPTGPDSHALIQAALDKLAAMPADSDGLRGAVLLKKGTWHLSGGLAVHSGVVLRGEGDGPEGTVLIFTMEEGNGVGIQLGRGAGGGTSSAASTAVSGTLSKGKLENGKPGFFLTLADGFRFRVRTPDGKASFRMDDFVGARVTVTFTAITTIQGNEKTVVLKHTKPSSIKKLAAGQDAPPLDPDLELPGAQSKAPEAMFESRIVQSYVPTGSSRVTVTDASGFRAGDHVEVTKHTNKKWIDTLGVGERLKHIRGGKEGANKKPWGPGRYHHSRRIVAIDGNTLTLDVMLPQSIDAQYGGGVVTKKPPSRAESQCGVESLRVVSNYDTSVTSQSKSANYRNLESGIGMSCRDGWVRNCTIMHTWLSAVTASDSRDSTVRNCRSLQPIGAVKGGKRYTYSISGSTGMLFFKCESEDGRHDFVVGARTMGPNAFVGCTAVRGGQSEPHARWGVGTLFDRITMKEGGGISASNRGDSGTGHGWAAANTVIWNASAPSVVVADPETPGENNFAIGYAGPELEEYDHGALWYSNTRAGYWGTPQEGKYYGHALMGSGHIESPDRRVEPNSLFAQQLIDRIGREQARTVLK